MQEFILSPKAKCATKKKVNTYLKELQKSAKSKKEVDNIQNAIVAIEDAHPRRPRGAYFDSQETLNEYYHVLHEVLTIYGILYMLFTDRRTVFEYKKKSSPSVEEDTFSKQKLPVSAMGSDPIERCSHRAC
jgi:hypothetical protein